MVDSHYVTVFGILLPMMTILLFFSCFFSASETAITSINIIRLKQIVKLKLNNKNKTRRIRKAKRIFNLVKDYDRTLATILIANTLINNALASIGTLFFSVLINNEIKATWVSTGVIGFVVLVIGEIIPKTLVKKNPEKFAVFISYVLFFWKMLFFPFTWIISLNKESKNSIISTTENELLDLISAIELEGVLEKNEKQLIESAITFDEKNISYVMQDKDKVRFIYNDVQWYELQYIYKKERFTRMPVFDRVTKEITGILNIKDVLIALIEKKEINILELQTDPIYVSKHLKLDDALELFQQKQVHLAIVTPNDESKECLGIVTLEDLIEELVGEIYDEDDETGKVKEIGRHMFWIQGSTSLKKVFKKYLKLTPPSESYGKTLYEWCVAQICFNNKSSMIVSENYKGEFIYNNFVFRMNNSGEKSKLCCKKNIIEIEMITDANSKYKL